MVHRAIVLLGALGGHITAPQIAFTECASGLGGRAVAAGTAGLHDDRITRFQRICFTLIEDFRIARFFDHGDLSGLAFFAPVHSPRRILDSIEHRLEVAVAQDFVSLAIAKSAAKPAGAAGIFTQPKLDNAMGYVDSWSSTAIMRVSPCVIVRNGPAPSWVPQAPHPP